MKIDRVRLVRFRRFRDSTVHLQDLSILAGANNSGKTTVLWAMKTFFHFCKSAAFEDRGALEFRNHYVHAQDFMPIPEDSELWFEKENPQNKPVNITVSFDNGWEGTLILTARFGQVHVSLRASELPDGTTATDLLSALRQEVAFIPGLVGVLVHEPFSTPARRHSLATEGRYPEIFRSSVFQLDKKSTARFGKLNNFLRDLFGIELLSPECDPDNHEFVVTRFSDAGHDYDIVECGSGVQQVIQMFTYLYLVEPTVVLVDEPDAHLHPSVQQSLGAGLARVQRELKAQMIVATHSYDIIDYFPSGSVIIVDPEVRKNAPLAREQDLIDKMTEVGLIANSALIRLNSSRYALVLEDASGEILQGLDWALRTGVAERYCLRRAKGVSKFGAQKEIVDALSAILQRPVNPVFIQDRDGLPDSWIEPLKALGARQGLDLRFLGRHEIENYLLDPSLLVKAIHDKGQEASRDDVESIIREAAQELAYSWRQPLRNRAQQVNHQLAQLPSWGQRSKERVIAEIDEYLDGLSCDVRTIIRAYPGKELLRAVRRRISARWGVTLSNEDIFSQADRRICREITALLRGLVEDTRRG